MRLSPCLWDLFNLLFCFYDPKVGDVVTAVGHVAAHAHLID